MICVIDYMHGNFSKIHNLSLETHIGVWSDTLESEYINLFYIKYFIIFICMNDDVNKNSCVTLCNGLGHQFNVLMRCLQ